MTGHKGSCGVAASNWLMHRTVVTAMLSITGTICGSKRAAVADAGTR